MIGNIARRLGLLDRASSLIRAAGLGGPAEYATQIAYGLRHPSLFRSGATAAEERMRLPGDRFVPEPMWTATRAITIDAPPDDVWPWIVQLGHGRGGWYTWEVWRERRAVPADQILPEFQDLRVGDLLLDSPDTDETQGAFRVRQLHPGRHLVLFSARDPFSGRELDVRRDRPRRFIEVVWSFVLRARPHGRTRLLVRVRVTYAPRWAGVAFRLLGAGDTVWHGTLLRGIKERAERMRTRHETGTLAGISEVRSGAVRPV